MRRLLLVLFLSLIVSMPFVSADDNDLQLERVQYYGIEARINRDFSVSHTITLIFDGFVSDIQYNFPSEIYGLEVVNKFGTSDCSSGNDIMGTKIKCHVTTDRNEANKTQIDIIFNTTDSVRKLFGNYRFEASYGISMPIDSLSVLIYMPPTGVLASDIASESYSPEDAKILTDGRHILLHWERENVTSTEGLNYAVMYVLPGEPDEMNNYVVTLLAIIALIAIAGFGFFIKRNTKETVIENVMPLLNKEEKKVIDVLRKHNNESMQKVVVNETDFSKAKVSRLIKDLAERNIIEVESLGKKNRIKLKVKLGKTTKEANS